MHNLFIMQFSQKQRKCKHATAIYLFVIAPNLQTSFSALFAAKTIQANEKSIRRKAQLARALVTLILTVKEMYASPLA